MIGTKPPLLGLVGHADVVDVPDGYSSVFSDINLVSLFENRGSKWTLVIASAFMQTD